MLSSKSKKRWPATRLCCTHLAAGHIYLPAMLVEALAIASLAGQVAARTLLFSPLPDASLASSSPSSSVPAPLPSCATFHGEYSGTAVYAYTEQECSREDHLQEWTKILNDGNAVLVHDPASVLLHVQPARTVAATSTTAQSWIDAVQKHIKSVLTKNLEQDMPVYTDHANQHVLAGEHTAATAADSVPKLVYADPLQHSAFISIPRSLLPIADLLFPSSVVLVSVPDHPLPLPISTNGIKVPKWLLDNLHDVHYSPLVDAILKDVDSQQIEKDVTHLTGEDGKADWETRHSFTDGGRKAGQWIKYTIEKESGVKCHYFQHNEGFSPDVICKLIGTEHPEELVILGAHYDSRGTFGQVRAPGGDDDASGVSALLSLARIFKSYNIQFKHSIVLAFFSGEEQGLLGSRAYAQSLKENEKEKDAEKVKFMLQADMIGYHAPGEPMQLALPDRYDTIEARWLVGNLSMTYVPELQVGTTPACCSDHQSFNQQGFVSTWVFERNGPIADPKYHNSGDISNRPGYDFEQIAAIAKIMLATALNVAGFTL